MTLNKAKGRMFKSVGWTWNPIAGCSHNCKYCWARSLTERWGKSFELQLREHFFKDKMPDDGSWIFVGSMGDVFCEGVPDEWIYKLINYIKNCTANNKFLLQTKNPKRLTGLKEALLEIKDKVILGTTIETTEETPWSSAPSTFGRQLNLSYLKHYYGFNTFLSLEPISDFDLDLMKKYVEFIQPEAIEIGKENYTHFTTPPPDEKIVALITWLNEQDYTVILKENLDYLCHSLDGSEKE